jgi:hypothetical protein
MQCLATTLIVVGFGVLVAAAVLVVEFGIES